MPFIKLNITGMTCDHCAKSAEAALNELEGVSAHVCFDSKTAEITTNDAISTDQLIKAVVAKGYSAILQSSADKALHIAIIGTGSGAFAAAIKAVELGAKVTIIEGADNIGGTCVNIGCVPSKIMIRGAHIAYLQQQHNVEGVPFNKPFIDRKAMVDQQQIWVENLRHAKYESILEANDNITLVRGKAHFKDVKTLTVVHKDGTEESIQADRFLIAVGARAMVPSINGLADTPFWTSTEALIAERLPKHLVVLGGSVVALELAQAFLHLGSQVTLIARSTLLSKEDSQIGADLKTHLEEEGMRIILQSVPQAVSHNEKGYILSTDQGDISSDQLLVATGRQSNADGLALGNAGVDMMKNGTIVIDDHMRTNVEHIYAVGDCTSQPQFVYVAAAAGTRAAKNMTGDDVALDLSVMPAVVFTSPQVATVGLTEEQAIKQGLDVDSRVLDLENVPRALTNLDTRGFIKLVAETESQKIIGCQVLANEGGEVIQTAALAIRNKMTIQDLADQLFPYLTMVEGLKLTAQTFNKDVKELSCCAG